MAPLLSGFNATAQKLSRNPLGIIALFIVLVYGIAALVLKFSSDNLQPNERLPFIYFLVIFPVIVLITFYRLVSHHHVKLYAPYDFPDKEGFFRALSPKEQKQKLDEEVKSIDEMVQEIEKAYKATEVKPKADAKDKIHLAEKEGTGIIQALSTRHVYILAEELAFREIESEFKVSVHRQVAIGPDHGVDGFFSFGGRGFVIEIKYTHKAQRLTRNIILHASNVFSQIAKYIHEPEFLLVWVTDGFSAQQRIAEKARLTKIIQEFKLSIHIRIFDFDELKIKYGIEEITT